VREHHHAASNWQKVELKGLDEALKPFRDELGFELIANALGVPKPTRPSERKAEADAVES
jgi:hypothetical protein